MVYPQPYEIYRPPPVPRGWHVAWACPWTDTLGAGPLGAFSPPTVSQSASLHGYQWRHKPVRYHPLQLHPLTLPLNMPPSPLPPPLVWPSTHALYAQAQQATVPPAAAAAAVAAAASFVPPAVPLLNQDVAAAAAQLWPTVVDRPPAELHALHEERTCCRTAPMAAEAVLKIPKNQWDHLIDHRLPAYAADVRMKDGQDLMPHQADAVKHMALPQVHGHVLAIATGGGKSLSAAAVCLELLRQKPNARVVVLAPLTLRTEIPRAFAQFYRSRDSLQNHFAFLNQESFGSTMERYSLVATHPKLSINKKNQLHIIWPEAPKPPFALDIIEGEHYLHRGTDLNAYEVFLPLAQLKLTRDRVTLRIHVRNKDNVTIVNAEVTLVSQWALMERVPWILVVDEAHTLRTKFLDDSTVDSRRLRAIYRMARLSWKSLFLTATPFPKEATDLLNVISMCKGQDPAVSAQPQADFRCMDEFQRLLVDNPRALVDRFFLHHGLPLVRFTPVVGDATPIWLGEPTAYSRRLGLGDHRPEVNRVVKVLQGTEIDDYMTALVASKQVAHQKDRQVASAYGGLRNPKLALLQQMWLRVQKETKRTRIQVVIFVSFKVHVKVLTQWLISAQRYTEHELSLEDTKEADVNRWTQEAKDNNQRCFGILTGDTSTANEARQKLLQLYNTGVLDVLILMSVGTVGLDLKMTDLAVWYGDTVPGDFTQAVGRINRKGSHVQVWKEQVAPKCQTTARPCACSTCRGIVARTPMPRGQAEARIYYAVLMLSLGKEPTVDEVVDTEMLTYYAKLQPLLTLLQQQQK